MHVVYYPPQTAAASYFISYYNIEDIYKKIYNNYTNNAVPSIGGCYLHSFNQFWRLTVNYSAQCCK